MKNEYNTFMNVNGLESTMHIAEKLTMRIDKNTGKELANALPHGEAQIAYPVDHFPACPKNWMKGSPKASSYFVKAEPEKGMWLNFNRCHDHTHDVAVVVSIQGVNPLTGQHINGNLKMEQHLDKCPIHNIDFQQDRFCPECKFEWPPQNYITTTTTPKGLFWIDGFRTTNGEVRQYIFTEERLKGIANQLIGDSRVFAIGIAFFLSKNPKPIQEIKGHDETRFTQPTFFSPIHVSKNWAYNIIKNKVSKQWVNPLRSAGSSSPNMFYNGSEQQDHVTYGSTSIDIQNLSASFQTRGFDDNGLYHSTGEIDDGNSEDFIQCSTGNMDKEVKTKGKPIFKAGSEELIIEEVDPQIKLEVGAGALIKQDICPDSKKLDYWEEEPAGIIYINYCDEKTIEKILSAGRRVEKENGYLLSVPSCPTESSSTTTKAGNDFAPRIFKASKRCPPSKIYRPSLS